MADQFTAGETFTEDEQVTHTKLNLAQTNLKFASAAVDGSTTALSSEAIIVKSGGITATQLATDAVTTVKIDDDAVTTAKILNSNVTLAKMAANSVDSDQYVDGSIDQEHLSADVITGQGEMTGVPHFTQDQILVSNNGTLERYKLAAHLPLPKAYGVVSFNASTPALVSGYNCSLGSHDDDTRQILITTDMSSGDYVVQLTPVCTGEGDSVGFDAPYVYIRNAADFTIAWSNAEGSTRAISFVVFGTLAT
tara:strand:+ start:91 stop:843 length:753 start_codon:yes stop_codon:yes gene_type:complete